MQKRLFGVLGGIGMLLVSCITGAQVRVSGNATAQQLAAKLAGPGVTILNPVLTCPTESNGIFRVTASNIGLDSGIVLTTGLAESVPGTNPGVTGAAYNLASTRNNAPGDPDLEPLAGQTTHDACALEFDVIPQGDTVKFDYVFGSEEYINATCGPYNDAFAFFISGPGIAGRQNMALVPGTNIPVTINSINSGIPGPGYSIANCNSMGPGSPFVSYFVNNNAGTTITYEGFTRVLQAYHAVTPCSTYHLKMAIADGGNYLYDSGVFIRAGSLQANTLKVQSVAGNNYAAGAAGSAFAVKGCAPGRFRIRRPQAKAVAETARFLIGGTAVNGYDYARIADSVIIPAGQQEAEVTIQGLPTPANGPKTVDLLVISPLNCSGSLIADSAVLVLMDTISIQLITPDAVICKGETLPLQVAGDARLTYRWSPLAGLSFSGGNNPAAAPLASTTYRVSATWPELGCTAREDSVFIRVLPVPQITVRPLSPLCPHQDVTLQATVQPAYSGYRYSWTGPAGYNATGAAAVIRDVRPKDSGYYYITVGLDTSRCAAHDSLLLILAPTPPPVVCPVIFCQDKPAVPLTAVGAQLLWYFAPEGGAGSSTAPVPNTAHTGTVGYYVTQTLFGCESERSRLPVEVRVCCDKPVFLPTAFTPNADGHNDTFSPRYAGYGYNTVRLRIFNRWGQMVFQSFGNDPWNGTWNNREAPAGTYYYELAVMCQEGSEQQFTGDVLLLR